MSLLPSLPSADHGSTYYTAVDICCILYTGMLYFKRLFGGYAQSRFLLRRYVSQEFTLFLLPQYTVLLVLVHLDMVILVVWHNCDMCESTLFEFKILGI